jgi:hypothetical protein
LNASTATLYKKVFRKLERQILRDLLPLNSSPNHLLSIVYKPGILASPKTQVVSVIHLSEAYKRGLTSVNVLVDEILDSALVHGVNGLRLERTAVLASVEHARGVHSALERISLPAEEVIGVCSESLLVTVAQDEGVAAIRGPHVGELGGIPQSLIRDLGNTDGVGCGARAGVLERVADGVVHVSLVVGRIEVLAIPASSNDRSVKGQVVA